MAVLNRALVVAVLACFSVGLGASVEETSSLSLGTETDKPHIVSKVITLLKEMLKELEAEAEADEEIYDKMSCWCETNDKRKTKAIADSEATIARLVSQIEEYTAMKGKLEGELEALKREMTSYAKSLDSAMAIRVKEQKEFTETEKGLLKSVAALKSAIVVLSKHHPASLLQTSSSVATTVEHELQKHAKLLDGQLSRKQRQVLAAFIGKPATALLQVSAGTSRHPQYLQASYFDDLPTSTDLLQDKSKQPQSGEVIGILKQMLETFEKDLADEQKDEGSDISEFMSLKSSMEEQMTAAKTLFDKKTMEVAAVGQKLVTDKLDLKDTRALLTTDEKFLAMLKEKCALMDREWEERQKTRAKEMEAVQKAIEIIGSDDAHDLMTKTLGTSLLQTESRNQKLLQAKASKILQSVARKINSPRLSALSVVCRIDAFVKVKRAIQDMIDQLMKEKKDEIKHKDWCVEELNTNQLDMEQKDREKADTEEKIEDLHMTIDTLTKEIKALGEEIATMKTQMKRGGEDREIENKDFQLTVADQRAVQKLLKGALGVLKNFYDKKAAALEQISDPSASMSSSSSTTVSSVSIGADNPSAPAGFKSYKTNKKSGSVMGMIQQIINDAKATEAEAILSEADAQKAYEDFVMDTNLSIDTAAKEIVNKSEQKAVAEVDLSEADEALEAIELELSQLENSKAQIHSSCDFVLKNFDLRQTARDEEIQALKTAKQILSGANFESFLQGRLAESKEAFLEITGK